jgi:uncharacterized protein YjbI with pentapeptide repeats
VSTWAAEAANVAELLTAYVGIATAAGTGIWAVTRFIADRRDARTHEEALAAQQLAQRQDEERRGRQQRAAELVKAVGEATDERGRRWAMSALSLYPDEALDLLLTALGEAEPQDASAIKLAVISVGPQAMAPTVRAHRIARQLQVSAGGDTAGAGRQVDTETAERVRDCTREIILQLLFQLGEQQRADVDLAHVDLAEVNLTGAHLGGIRFRKTRLDRAVLIRAALNEAVLRGATIDGAVLREARLRRADLTGAAGKVHAIGVDLTGATLSHATLAESDLSAAQMKGVVGEGTDLAKATLAGATLAEAQLTGARLCRAVANHLRAERIQARAVDLSHAQLGHAALSGGVFEDCLMVRLDAAASTAEDARFTRCNLGGARWGRAHLARAHLQGCNLGGVDLAGADLREAVVEDCAISSAVLDGATLRDTRFVRCRFSGRVDFTAVDLTSVAFESCEFAESTALVSGNDTWTQVGDHTARELFARAARGEQAEPAAPPASGDQDANVVPLHAQPAVRATQPMPTLVAPTGSDATPDA